MGPTQKSGRAARKSAFPTARLLCANGLNRSRGRALRQVVRSGEIQGGSCLKMRSCNPHSRQEPPHDRPGHEPVTPAHDRRHDDPQVSAKDPTRLYPDHQGFCCVPRPIARQGEFRGRPTLSTASGGERRTHSHSQSHRGCVAVLLQGHAQAIRHHRAHDVHPRTPQAAGRTQSGGGSAAAGCRAGASSTRRR
jgi:hypothetical protein